MTEPQVWTVIGVFAALMFGTVSLIPTLFLRVLRTEIGAVRVEIGAVRTEIGAGRAESASLRSELGAAVTSLRAESASLRSELVAEIGGVRTEVRAMGERIDNLDRDVQALVKHTFGTDRS